MHTSSVALVASEDDCTGGWQEYGSPQMLRAAFARKRAPTVPLKKAKQYFYVKMCLIKLS